ncbi:ATP synthase subunit I [Fervidibacillus halotolerans]|uniref:ATP synthase subunit I n=1 Tax=Fervidibacillus halotolerans TaxID=2980027 RepID=A0A9E8RWW7_9BACI|nr:ATP synthase subunit I [Fervidibacillus halotolerans]WAA12180.1 ATP synthase subunit I [Fervidibacillus halotolerans]
MPDLELLYNRYKKYMYFILAIVALGWGFTVFKTFFAGLFLGISVSFLNLWLLKQRTLRLSKAVQKNKTVYSIGTFSRLAYVALAVLVALKYPDVFHLIATIIGFTVSYIVIFIDLIVLFFKKQFRQEER